MHDILNLMESFKPPQREKLKLENRGIDGLSEWSDKVELRESKRNGRGLFTITDLPKGTLLWAQDESKINRLELSKLFSFEKSKRGDLFL